MKVFVYSKRTSKRIALIENVIFVNCPSGSEFIDIMDKVGNKYSFKVREVKTSIYQN